MLRGLPLKVHIEQASCSSVRGHYGRHAYKTGAGQQWAGGCEPGLVAVGSSRLTSTAATPVSVLFAGSMATDGVTTSSTKSPSVAAALTQGESAACALHRCDRHHNFGRGSSSTFVLSSSWVCRSSKHYINSAQIRTAALHCIMLLRHFLMMQGGIRICRCCFKRLPRGAGAQYSPNKTQAVPCSCPASRAVLLTSHCWGCSSCCTAVTAPGSSRVLLCHLPRSFHCPAPGSR